MSWSFHSGLSEPLGEALNVSCEFAAFHELYVNNEPSARKGTSLILTALLSFLAPRESQSAYPRNSFRGGYWAGPKPKEDNR